MFAVSCPPNRGRCLPGTTADGLPPQTSMAAALSGPAGTTSAFLGSRTPRAAPHTEERKQGPDRGGGVPDLTSTPLPEEDHGGLGLWRQPCLPWPVPGFQVPLVSEIAGPVVPGAKQQCSALGFPGSAHRKPPNLGLPTFLP